MTKPSTSLIHAALPRYRQIAEQIARQIEAGHLVVGQKLPPERDMAAQYEVAVGTIRKALAHCEELGLLTRRQGSGNYVTDAERSGALYSFFRLELPDGGGLPRAEMLAIDTMTKPDHLPAFGDAPTAHRFRRKRYLDDRCVALEEIWLDASTHPALPATEISESLYLYYRDCLDIWITHAEDSLSLGQFPDWTPQDFPVPAGENACLVERFSYVEHRQKIEYSRTWFDSRFARYVARLT